MFSRPNKPFAKDKVITASDLNWLKREATKILIGGPGMAVTRIGGRTVVSRIGSQTIRRGAPRGHLYCLSTGLGHQWAFDIVEEIGELNNGGAAVYDVAVNSSTIYCVCSGLLREDGSFHAIKLTSTGTLVWHVDGDSISPKILKMGQCSIGTSDTMLMSLFGVGKPYSGACLHSMDGSIVYANEGIAGSLHGMGCFWDGTYSWSVLIDGANWKLTRRDSAGSCTATGTFGGTANWYERLYKSGSYVYLAGWNNTAGTYSHFRKVDTSAALQWGYDTGGFPGVGVRHKLGLYNRNPYGIDICVDASGNVYGVGHRSNTWTGSGGAYASLWKLDSSGSLLWAWDSGNDLNSCCVDDDGNVYVCGVSSTTWTGGTNRSTVWKLDSGGTALAHFDTGPYNLDESIPGQAFAVRHYGGNIYVGCHWDGL